MSSLCITVNDMGSVLYCVKGSRAFAKRHRLDFRKFCHEGINAEDLLATGDGMAIELVNRIKKERGME